MLRNRTSRTKRVKRQPRDGAKQLRFEYLDDRRMLAGLVFDPTASFSDTHAAVDVDANGVTDIGFDDNMASAMAGAGGAAATHDAVATTVTSTTEPSAGTSGHSVAHAAVTDGTANAGWDSQWSDSEGDVVATFEADCYGILDVLILGQMSAGATSSSTMSAFGGGLMFAEVLKDGSGNIASLFMIGNVSSQGRYNRKLWTG